jgi:hypothetical protein
MKIIILLLLFWPWGWYPVDRERGIPPGKTPDTVEHLSDYDIKLLAKLGVVECRGMGEYVEDCTRSVVSTILRRMDFYEETHGSFGLSDGTVYGTLDHNYQGLWQFPPWVTRGCEFVSEEACLDWVDLDPFVTYVKAYLDDRGAVCDGFLYYDSIPGGNSECKIETPWGWIEFHQGWGWEPK